MKKNSIFKVVLLTILVMVVCTWIFKVPQLSNTGLIIGDRSQLGVFTIGQYVQILFQYFFQVVLVILSMGAFYGVAYRIPAYRDLLDMLVEKSKGKESIILAVIMALIAIIVSISGLQLGIIFVFPFVISLVMLMGYNKLVAASVTVGSTIVGLIGTTLGTSTTYYFDSLLKVSYDSEMISKIILLVVATALLIYNVLVYAKKTRNETDRVLEFVPGIDRTQEEVETVKVAKKVSVFAKILKKKPAKKEKAKAEKKETTKKATKPATKAAAKPAAKKPAAKKKAPAKKSTKTKANNAATAAVKVVKNTGKKANIWPFVVIFDLTLIIMILSVFDWQTIFNTSWPTDALNAIRDFKIFDFDIFNKLLGGLNPWGQWSIAFEIPFMIFVMSGILALVYKVKFDKFIEGMLDGMKKAFVPATVMLLAYLVLVICVENMFQLHFIKFFMDLNKGLNAVGMVFTVTLSFMFGSVFNVDTVYLAQVVLPYITTVISDTALYPILAVMGQAVYGLMMLIAPTSLVLIGTLSFLDVPYLQWLKHIWKLFLELLLVLLVIFLILVLV